MTKNSHPKCPLEGGISKGIPLSSGLTLQHIMLIAAGVCTAITLILSLSLIFSHLRRYTNPAEQRQIIRILFTPVVYAVLNVFGIAWYIVNIFLTPVADLYEAFALAGLFLLLVQWVAPDSSQHEHFFSRIDVKTRKGEVTPGGSVFWFKYIWVVVFLYCVVKFILVVAQEASQGTGRYCANSDNVHFGHIWITIFGAVTVTIAVLAVLRFYNRFKKDMAHHQPLAKLISFKAIVFANFLQTLIFSFLNSGGHLKGNLKCTHLDLWLGIPSLLVCFEQVLFAAFFYYSYPSAPYKLTSSNTPNGGLGFFHACLDAMNPSDLIWGIVRAFYFIFGACSGGNRGGGRGAKRLPPPVANGGGAGLAQQGQKFEQV